VATYHVWVECKSVERFDVSANSFEEAKALYELGICSLKSDEVRSRDELSVEDETGECREYEVT
jgi:hypothetical protein